MQVDLFKHPVSFRLPTDMPIVAQNYLVQLKKREGRNYSKHLYTLLLKGIMAELQESENKNKIAIPISDALTKEQRELLQQSAMQQFLGELLPILLTKPSSVLQNGETPINVSKPKIEEGEKYRNRFLNDLFADMPNQK